MGEAIKKISAWIEEAEAYTGLQWEQLPEIYLYMDQVLTYMNKQFSPFERNENADLLTSSMINNYVKDGILPRPEQKKYSRHHLALLTVICMLKQVLSITDINMLLKTALKDNTSTELYNDFTNAQTKALHDVSKRVKETAPQGDADLTRLAIALSIEANARRTAAERILSELSATEEQTLRKEKK